MTSTQPAQPATSHTQHPLNTGLSNQMPVTQAGVANLPKMAVQQRQILALMGIEVWVSQDRQAQQVDYEHYRRNADDQIQQQRPALSVTQPQTQIPIQSQSQSTDSIDNTATAPQVPQTEAVAVDAIHTLLAKTKVANLNIAPDKAKQDAAELNKPAKTLAVQQVAPFEVVAAHYHGWVLLADTSAFENEQAYQLWQNILQGLSLTPDVQKFPICSEISDQENANACVAGFVFRVAQSVDVNVATLTPMPEGVTHEQVVRVPYLTEMLADSQCKKQLWDMIAPRLD